MAEPAKDDLSKLVSVYTGEADDDEPLNPDLVTPAGLSPAGTDLWLSIASRYQLRPDDVVVLDMAAKAQTTLDAVEARWADEGYPMVGEGYNGQPVEHPLVTMADKQRKTLAALLRQLRLPDDETGYSPFSHAGRGSMGGKKNAANITYSRRKGGRA